MDEMVDEILNSMGSRKQIENSLAKEVDENHWVRRNLPFQDISPTDLHDFPELTRWRVRRRRWELDGLSAVRDAAMAVAKVSDLSVVDSVRMVGCPDATIGTRVDLKGDLIVNQFLRVDGASQPTDLKTLKQLLVHADNSRRFHWRSLKVLLASALLAAITTATVIGLTLGLVDRASDGDVRLPMNYTARFMKRGNWSAWEHGVEKQDLEYQPAKFVVVIHTAGPACSRSIFCETIVRGIQNYHLSQGYGDIGYNFLIGGDGYIYEGRGWGKYGAHTYGVNCASVGVAFIGDYDSAKLSEVQRSAFQLIIEEGLRTGQLDPDYKLFSQSQILNTSSPGLKIKEEIKSWSHYSNLSDDDLICLKNIA